MNTTDIITIGGEVVALITTIVPLFLKMSKVIEGQRCQMRTEMLRIYYANRDKEEIRQFELENFIALYEGYKALKGNSFIEKIYQEIMKWKVIL